MIPQYRERERGAFILGGRHLWLTKIVHRGRRVVPWIHLKKYLDIIGFLSLYIYFLSKKKIKKKRKKKTKESLRSFCTFDATLANGLRDIRVAGGVSNV